MDIPAGARFFGAARHGQAGRLSGQEAAIREMAGCPTRMRTREHFDAVVTALRVTGITSCSERRPMLFLPGHVAPPKRGGGQQKDKRKHLDHVICLLPERVPNSLRAQFRLGQKIEASQLKGVKHEQPRRLNIRGNAFGNCRENGSERYADPSAA